jgi:thymidylate synthase (FAD)
MNVSLKAVTQPIEDLQNQGIKTAEDFIVYCARVSNPTNQFNTDTNERLINYCIKHQHWSIFEQAFCTFEIVTSRAIAAQILRHRSFTFQEFSQRYSTATELVRFELRKQGKTNRQVGDELLSISEHIEIFDDIDHLQHQSISLYNKLVEKGIAKECARMVLPLNTQTTLYMSGSIRSFIHYIDLRSKKDTQKEHRDIALAMKEIFLKTFPTIAKALEWNN